mgnify:CR=1 FL=1
MGIYKLDKKLAILKGNITIFQKDRKYKSDSWYGLLFIKCKYTEDGKI